MTEFTIEPVADENYEGRQCGWKILKDGQPFLNVHTGGTGPCWNIEDAENDESVEYPDRVHICDLDEWIEALTMLRDSDAHKQNVEQWRE